MRNSRATEPVTKSCEYCGSTMQTTAYRISRGMGKFCGRECFDKSKIGKPSAKDGGISAQCKQCGVIFKTQKARIAAGRGKFCSKNCADVHRVGKYTPWNKGRPWPEMAQENNPSWKGGTATEYELIKGGFEYKLWRKSVLERDSYTCQSCGSKQSLHAHHILKFSDFPHKRVDISNGITLCKPCHWKAHGKKENKK